MKRTPVLLALALAGLVASGCSGGTPTAHRDSSANRAADGVGELVAGPAPRGAVPASIRALDVGPQVVRTVQIALQVRDVGASVDQAAAVARGVNGYVASEQTRLDAGDPRHGTATLQLKIPATSYAAAVGRLRELGRVTAHDETAEDVSDAVIDSESRLRTQRASVERVRLLLARANTVGEVVAIESELAKREADLESLQARVRSLHGQVEYATITVTLSRSAAPPPETSHPAGFLAGLDAGWTALTGVGRAFSTALGAVLPFIPLALLALLAWVLVRRRVRERSRTASA